ncbi:hypothetical protein CDD83_8561 [Cordyceps sp. RAO-2017]|nr:hypothetical protein CDD83_8561 [Cordyceps sp. RAO-2017]
MAALTHHRDDLLLRSLGGQSKSSAAPPAAEGSYCLYSSSHAQSAAGTRVLAAGTSLDKFVTLLSNQEIILKAGPTDDNLVGQVDSSDLWAKWMAYLDPAGILSLTFDSAGAGGQVASFSYSFTNPWDVTFSSDANTLLFVFGSQTGTGAARIPVPGLMPDGSLLYLGLEPGRTATNVTSTVKELAAFSGIETVLPNAVTGWGLTLNPKSAGGKRNALWFDPSSMETTVRLQFGVDGGADLFGTLLAEALPGLSVYSVDAVAKKTFVLADTEAGAGAVVNGSFSFQAECSVAAKTGPGQVDMMACVECFKNAYSIDLLLTTRNSLAGLLAWLSELIAGGSLDSINEILAKDDVFGGVEARQLQIALDTDDESGKLVLSSFKIDLEVSASFGKSNTGSSSVVFLISYAWSKEIGGDGILRGDFWNWFDTSPTRDLGPAYERVEDLYPLAENPALTISLVNIVPGLTVQNMPANIPTDITTAFISLSQDGCLLGGTIESQMWESSSGGYPVPQLDLGVLSLDASYSWGTSENLQLSLGVLAEMKPSTASKHQQSAYLIGSLDYSSGDSSWKLQASLDGLYATTLYEFFDEASADHVMPLLDSVELANANLLYEYAGKAAAGKSAGSHFKMDGQLLIAALQLNLAFEYKDKGWTFTATLAAQNGQATMGDILNSFLGDDDLDLPDFLANMPFSYADGHALDLVVKKCSGNVTASGSKDGSSTAEGGNAASGSPDKDDEAASDSKDDALAAESDQGGNGSSSSSGGGGDTFQLVAQISLGPLQLTFAQIHGSSWPATEPSKRLVQVALTKLPSFDVALIGRLEQPFDEMYYMWIQDATTQIQGQQAAGLSRGDIAALNPSFSAHQLVPKDTFKNPTAGDLLMAAGSHLAVIMKNSSGERSCVLDYCFQKKVAAAVATETPGQATKPLAGKAKEPQGSDAAGDSRDPDESQEPTASSDSSGQDSDGTSSEAPLKKKIGPLSISNIGLKYADKTLHVKLDAELALGPLAFSLMGFSIDVELTSLDPSKMGMPSFSLSGLSVIFNKTPLTIAGIVVHSDDDGLNYYAGGLIVGYIPYQLEAAGFYGEATPEGAAAGAGKTFTSVFVFARLDGPLVTLEFAEISGVTGGFGYKSRVRVPAPDQISDFPFIATQQLDGASDSALQALERLTSPKGDGWFSPVDDSYWAAAGMKIDAFKMLSVDAVIVLQFGASVKLGLFGVAVLDVPNAKSPINRSPALA